MTAVSRTPKGIRAEDGKQICDVFIIANTTPDPLPTNGKNVKGLSEDDVFAPMSILYVVEDAETKLYIANEAGQFVAQ